MLLVILNVVGRELIVKSHVLVEPLAAPVKQVCFSLHTASPFTISLNSTWIVASVPEYLPVPVTVSRPISQHGPFQAQLPQVGEEGAAPEESDAPHATPRLKRCVQKGGGER